MAHRAQHEDRVLLTQDTDFGRIALRHSQPRTGVVILRAAVADIDRVAVRLVHLIEHSGNDLANAVTVLDDRGVRSRRIVREPKEIAMAITNRDRRSKIRYPMWTH